MMTTDTMRIGARDRVELARTAGWCGVIAGPLWVLVVAALTVAESTFLTRAGWSLLGENKIPYPSYTARGPYGYVQTINFALAGLLVLTFVAGLSAHLRGWTGTIARVLWSLTGAGITASAFTTDKVPGPMTWHGAIHAGSFFAIVVTSVFGLMFAGLSLRRSPGWRRWGSGTAALAGWQVLMFTVGGAILPGDVSFYCFVLGLFGWVGATGARLLRAG
jgi:uncharacterized protein DUF998